MQNSFYLKFYHFQASHAFLCSAFGCGGGFQHCLNPMLVGVTYESSLSTSLYLDPFHFNIKILGLHKHERLSTFTTCIQISKHSEMAPSCCFVSLSIVLCHTVVVLFSLSRGFYTKQPRYLPQGLCTYYSIQIPKVCVQTILPRINP